MPIKSRLLLCIALLALMSGCATRSISNSDCDPSKNSWCARNAPAELSEFDVLGIAINAHPSEADIAAALAKPRTLTLNRASRILLIQSGAAFPDAPMRDALNKRYLVGSFSGAKPPAALQQNADDAANYSRSLRFAAAQGGFDKVLVYWGVLESARKNYATSAVSWVPVIGWGIPDEKEQMRIRLKLVLIDVASGQWDMFEPTPAEDSSSSSIMSRREDDQTLVAKLKARGYETAADELSKRFER